MLRWRSGKCKTAYLTTINILVLVAVERFFASVLYRATTRLHPFQLTRLFSSTSSPSSKTR
jgi:hypothetical protein